MIMTHKYFGDLILDWKTTSGDINVEREHHYEQATAYCLMFNELTGHNFENYMVCVASPNFGGLFRGTFGGIEKHEKRLKQKIELYHEKYPC